MLQRKEIFSRNKPYSEKTRKEQVFNKLEPEFLNSALTLTHNQTGDRKMSRLDSLSKDELKKLYTRSATLFEVGNLVLFFIILCSVFCIIGAFFTAGLSLLFGIPGIFLFFASAYVFKYVRTPVARTYFYVWSITGIIGGTLNFLTGICSLQSVGFAIGKMIGGIILLLISIGVLKSAKTDALFGPGSFTHKQIALARKKMRKGENFLDEDLPESYPNQAFAKVCVVCAFILEGLFILSWFAAMLNALLPPAK